VNFYISHKIFVNVWHPGYPVAGQGFIRVGLFIYYFLFPRVMSSNTHSAAGASPQSLMLPYPEVKEKLERGLITVQPGWIDRNGKPKEDPKTKAPVKRTNAWINLKNEEGQTQFGRLNVITVIPDNGQGSDGGIRLGEEPMTLVFGISEYQPTGAAQPQQQANGDAPPPPTGSWSLPLLTSCPEQLEFWTQVDDWVTDVGVQNCESFFNKKFTAEEHQRARDYVLTKREISGSKHSRTIVRHSINKNTGEEQHLLQFKIQAVDKPGLPQAEVYWAEWVESKENPDHKVLALERAPFSILSPNPEFPTRPLNLKVIPIVEISSIGFTPCYGLNTSVKKLFVFKQGQAQTSAIPDNPFASLGIESCIVSTTTATVISPQSSTSVIKQPLDADKTIQSKPDEVNNSIEPNQAPAVVVVVEQKVAKHIEIPDNCLDEDDLQAYDELEAQTKKRSLEVVDVQVVDDQEQNQTKKRKTDQKQPLLLPKSSSTKNKKTPN
jgi:hypothetical protein